jgi:hypothetical protein
MLPIRRTWSLLAVGSTIIDQQWQLATWSPLMVGNMVIIDCWQHDRRWQLDTRLPHAVGNMVIIDGWQHDRRWRLETRLVDYNMRLATWWSPMFGKMMATVGWQHRESVPSNVDWKGSYSAGSGTSHHVKYHERL